MQEAEIARLTEELSRQKSRKEEEERNQKIVMEELATTVSQLQLKLMSIRGSLQSGDDNTELLTDLIKVYRSLLLQHIALYPLSPLREEAHDIEVELCQLLNEPQL
ncbi:hypothetical protein LSM04_003603 [Trypanosoma melophagium]|uniref:uncharacterized protein n=1 Tax=Trypanosoma melophagium TaxID=715481 RepID=UPI00351A96AD|nr:hypothetical protein LSM04_003603 [Trypanosoma melophagium]